MTKAVAKVDTFRDLMEKSAPQLEAALPAHVPVEKFLRVAMTHLQRTPKLLDCDPISVLGAVMESAQLGLSLDDSLGEAHLIPFGKVAKLIPGYRGLIKLACQSGHVSHMQARLFYEGEYFQYVEGTSPRIDHTPLPPDERGEALGAYSVAKLQDGEVSFDLMWAADIKKIMDGAPGAKYPDSAWTTNPDEMWRKTVVRRHIKYLSLSPELSDAVRTAVKDEYLDAGIIKDVPIAVPKATKPIEEGEPAAVVVDEPPKVEGKKRGPGRPKKEEKVEEKPPEQEEPQGESVTPDLFSQEDNDLFEVKAKIRELGEAMGKQEKNVEKDILSCANGKEQLDNLRMFYVRDYNASLQK